MDTPLGPPPLYRDADVHTATVGQDATVQDDGDVGPPREISACVRVQRPLALGHHEHVVRHRVAYLSRVVPQAKLDLWVGGTRQQGGSGELVSDAGAQLD
jgi:hypothetical protein